MNILFAASEAVPLIKTGGLADVVGALPRALQREGSDVRIIVPKYEAIPAELQQRMETVAAFTVGVGWRRQYCGLLRMELDGIIYYTIDNEYYFKRSGLYGYGDDAERFVFFALAVAEALRYLDFRPNIIHGHDWQAGLVPMLLKTRYRYDPACRGVKTVFTIHNLMYQGVFAKELLMDLLGAGEELFGADGLEFYGAGSCIKGGLIYADKLTTVSPTYASEIQTEAYGEKLDGLLRQRSVTGIINGLDLDLFDPQHDAALAVPYRHELADKRKNKLALQAELGLPVQEDTPMIGIVSRLVDQKGLDLIAAVLERLMAENVQLVVLGEGEQRYEHMLRTAAARWQDKLHVTLGFDDRLARKIYAGSDMYLMPSRFEPCGISQLIALRYRSVPIVRETGGLKDTVLAYNEYTGEGNGFSFTHYNADDMLYTIRRALHFYCNRAVWERIAGGKEAFDWGWQASAQAYMALYRNLLPELK
ncbi:glycogen synthase GlgA [Paenibacillus sp. GCM10027626]|uniref:glycogen synthase GlgA n=1 Tax=Paenibacillus sp. GCM10027626 TaxID=3273411 RepID=UPI0036370E84